MARKPRVKKPAKERAVKAKRRAPGVFALVVFALVAGVAALAAWLTYSFQPSEQSEPTADLTRAMMSIDLTKEGRGEQDPPRIAAKAAHGHGGDDGEEAHQPAKKEAGPGTKTKPKNVPPSPEPTVEDNSQKSGGQKSDGKKSDAQKAADQHKDKQAADPAPKAAAKQAGPRGSFTRSGGLRPAPDPALVKSSDDGPLPVVAADGRTPLQVYARPYKATGRPRIALVVGGLGMSQATTLAAIQQLPGGVTLAFAPYGRTLQDYVNQARAAGHEVLLQVPMEPMDYPTNDPGPHTLLTSLTINRNLKRLDWLLGRFTGYVGVINFMGGRFTSAQSHLAPILEAMRGRGLMFLDSRAASSSVAVDIAGKVGLYVAAADRVVDVTPSRAAIDARLLELERLASASGGAVGIGFPYPVTIERLAQWTRAMGDRGYDLAPISALTSHGKAIR